jgi:hypothetical protein
VSTDQQDAICATGIFIFMFLYGAWLTIKAMRQIREPTHVRDLGIGWLVNLSEGFARKMNAENADDLDQTLALPGMVRLAAVFTLGAGVAMMMMPFVAWILVRWVLP